MTGFGGEIRDMFTGEEREPLLLEVREEETAKPKDPNQGELPLADSPN